MKFGKQLEKNSISKWQKYYISYKHLKKLVKNAEESTHGDFGPSEESITAFFSALDRELEKVNNFYVYKRNELEQRINILSEKANALSSETNETASDVHEQGKDLALLDALIKTNQQAEDLLYFSEMCRKGFDKILKKFDKKLKKNTQGPYIDSKVTILPFVSTGSLSNSIATLDAPIKSLSAKIAESKQYRGSPNSRLDGLSAKNFILSEDDNNVIARALDTDDVASLRNILGRLFAKLDVGSNSAKNVLSNLLYRACTKRAFTCITALFEYGAQVTIQDDVNEHTLLHKLAMSGGRLPQLDKLGNSSPPQSTNTSPVLKGTASDTLIPPSASTPVGSMIDDPSVLEYILHLLPLNTVTAVRDSYGRTPIHYAAMIGCSKITRALLQHLENDEEYSRTPFVDPSWCDNDGYTPLFYAISGGYVGVVEAILDVGGDTIVNSTVAIGEVPYPFPLVISTDTITTLPHPTLQTPLSLACKHGRTQIVHTLILRNADLNMLDETGEAPLHVAVADGFLDGVKALVEANKYTSGKEKGDVRHLDLDIKERYYGYTPLMLAAIAGYFEIAQTLVEAGANVNSKDNSGWDAHEHALFRGHLTLGRYLNPFINPYSPMNPIKNSLVTEPVNQSDPDRKFRSQAYDHLRRKESIIFLTVGSTDTRLLSDSTSFVNLSRPTTSQIPTYLSLVITARNAQGTPGIIDLPPNGSTIATYPEPVVFFADCLEDVIITFDLVPMRGSTNSTRKDRLIGRASTMLEQVQRYPRGSCEGVSLRGQMAVPIIGTEALEPIGSIRFEYVIVRPFEHENMNLISLGSKGPIQKKDTKLIGHRGLGMNRTTGRLQLGENTIASFLAAGELGAEYVEFDVQLTKDEVPVIYHDFVVSETGLDIPMNTITLEQFLTLRPSGRTKEYHTGTSEMGSIAFQREKPSNRYSEERMFGMKRSKSVGTSSAKVSDKMQFTKKYKEGKMKAEDSAIQAPFTTLAETFKMVPPHIGFNIEVKYPMVDEAERDDMFSHHELNLFVDRILQCVYDHAGQERKIIFSSFSPETCLFLNLKQPNYPVFFLSDSGCCSMADYRCNSLQEAVRFARSADLIGIVTASEPILAAPRLVRIIKHTGLLLFTYGNLNNEVANAQLQRDFDVDALIVDSVLAIRKGLQ